jgi:hypothetical protein
VIRRPLTSRIWVTRGSRNSTAPPYGPTWIPSPTPKRSKDQDVDARDDLLERVLGGEARGPRRSGRRRRAASAGSPRTRRGRQPRRSPGSRRHRSPARPPRASRDGEKPRLRAIGGRQVLQARRQEAAQYPTVDATVNHRRQDDHDRHAERKEDPDGEQRVQRPQPCSSSGVTVSRAFTSSRTFCLGTEPAQGDAHLGVRQEAVPHPLYAKHEPLSPVLRPVGVAGID